MMKLFLPALAAVAIMSPANAEITLSALFSDHAVLQRDQPLPIRGTASPGETIRVSLGERTATAVADDSGRWAVPLAAQAVSAAPLVLRVAGADAVLERSDILFGDVWHASGQSNMAMNVGACARSLDEVRKMIEDADDPAIRFVRINDAESEQPLENLRSPPTWICCSPQTVSSFSAAAYFFARRIHEEVRVPIGIIDSSRGGTPIEPFIPREAFTGHSTLVRERELGDANDLAGIRRLPGGVRARDANWLPGRLFNSRMEPIRDFPVRGVLWYQAESNCGVQEDPRDYEHKMRALVSGWRSALERADLPFYFVQLPGSGAGSNWPCMREQQRLASDIPHSGMVVSIDLEHPNIHPPNKVDVGERLARWALAKDYGKNVPCSGPLFAKATPDGNRITVDFSHAESGLMTAAKSGLDAPVEDADGTLNHFEMIDSAGVWHPAVAVVSGAAIVVSCDKVDRASAVRYAFAVSPSGCNLYNRDGLPASPFCSRPDLLICDPGLPTD